MNVGLYRDESLTFGITSMIDWPKDCEAEIPRWRLRWIRWIEKQFWRNQAYLEDLYENNKGIKD
jgi:hypothetical protein